MRTARSASRTCSAPSSAVEYTATASMPSSCSARITRTAISPRFATRTRLNTRKSLRIGPFGHGLALPRPPAPDASRPAATARAARARAPPPRARARSHDRSARQRLEVEQRLPELDRRCVLDVDRADDGLELGLYLVHELHRLENAERLPGCH